MAITQYLQKLIELKNQLADNLTLKGVDATQEEKFNTLVPKVLNIAQSTLENSDYVIKLNSNTTVVDSAFRDCSSITSITIPNSVTSIGKSAFYGCSSLTNITIPDTVTSIDGYAFYGCSSITSITIPNGVPSIGNYLFNGCSSLTSITIPNSVTSIGGYAFNDCTSLTDVYYTGTEEEWNSISISASNVPLSIATKHYNYTV